MRAWSHAARAAQARWERRTLVAPPSAAHPLFAGFTVHLVLRGGKWSWTLPRRADAGVGPSPQVTGSRVRRRGGGGVLEGLAALEPRRVPRPKVGRSQQPSSVLRRYVRRRRRDVRRHCRSSTSSQGGTVAATSECPSVGRSRHIPSTGMVLRLPSHYIQHMVKSPPTTASVSIPSRTSPSLDTETP